MWSKLQLFDPVASFDLSDLKNCQNIFFKEYIKSCTIWKTFLDPIQKLYCRARIVFKGRISWSLNVKFIYSEKATKFYEISTVDLSYVVPVKYKVEISQNFLAFSKYLNCIVLNLVFEAVNFSLKFYYWISKQYLYIEYYF